MSIGLIFWVLMLIWLVFGILGAYSPGAVPNGWYAHGLFAFILFFLLGWKCFGFIVQGP